ncbi:MAG: tRNA glutamyl-Q(34) synthetase GluQRS [Propionibacteriaceae bacterium]|nr:tRNA glutamyl-Q(34) synthetase GluQRS [Propionibacteriaceae bacterium]
MDLLVMFGRFAPTPSADLHLGNLRTAVVAWLTARASGRGFLIRIEDLDQPRLPQADTIAARQLADLATLGIDHDQTVVRQRDRTDRYVAALAGLDGLIYECFCSRKDVAEATRAPHGATAHYPGTCRHLSPTERDRRRRIRPPAWRINADAAQMSVTDLLHGQYSATVDDFIVRRADGVFSYNFAVVVDDGLQEVDQVVRGEDLLESAPRQAWLAHQLGLPVPNYLHVPLVLATDGSRLAKRDRSASLDGLGTTGISASAVLSHIASSLGLTQPGEPVKLPELVERFDPTALPRQPWLVDPSSWVTSDR